MRDFNGVCALTVLISENGRTDGRTEWAACCITCSARLNI